MQKNEQVSYVVRWPSGYELEYDNIGHALDCFYEEVDDPNVANDEKPVCVLRRTIIDEILT